MNKNPRGAHDAANRPRPASALLRRIFRHSGRTLASMPVGRGPWIRWGVCAAVLLVGGCTSRDAADSPSQPSRAEAAGRPVEGGQPDRAESAGEAGEAGEAGGASSAAHDRAPELDVQIVDWAQLQEKLRTLRGQVVVLDVWSTSCGPCLLEFPHLVELARQRAGQVQCVSLNLDYIGLPKKPPESYVPAVLEFLHSVDARGILHFVASEPDDVVRERLDIASIPAVLIYDREGRLVHKITDANAGEDGVSYAADVLPKLEELLTAQSR